MGWVNPVFLSLSEKGNGRDDNTQKRNPFFGPLAKSVEGRVAKTFLGNPHFRDPQAEGEELTSPKGSPLHAPPSGNGGGRRPETTKG